MYQVGNLMHDLFLQVCELFLLTLTLQCTVWGPAFLIGINQYVATLEQRKQVWWQAEPTQSKQNLQEFCAVCEEQTFRYLKEVILREHQWFINRVVD